MIPYNRMSSILKILAGVLVIGALAYGVAFVTARYLASRLDGTHAPKPHMMQYSSEDGVSFMYPATYELSSRTEGSAERRWDILLLLPAGYVPPQGGEGPPAISVGVFANPEGLGLEQWVRGDSRSNFKLSSDAALAPATVGGMPAVAYAHSGLYEADAVAVAASGKIFLFEAGWHTPSDAIRTDFQSLIKTVQFSYAR